jgi:polyhydroxybutyrate depolymerase
MPPCSLRAIARAAFLAYLVAVIVAVQSTVAAPLAAQAPPAGFVRRTLVVGGTARDALVRFPASRPATAVVLLLHGRGGSGAALVDGAGRAAPYRAWLPIADREGLVLVAPDGLAGPDGSPGWNDCRGDSEVQVDADDTGFLTQLADTVAREAKLARRLVFAVGTSNGGQMALRLAVEQPALVTAVAAVAAAMPATSRCVPPRRAVPVLVMAGTDDRFSPYGGGRMAGAVGAARGTVLSADASVAAWTRLAGVARAGEVVERPRSRATGTRVVRTTWGPPGRPVAVLVRVEGGGHVEPSIAERYGPLVTGILGRQDDTIEMADEVWRFFVAFAGP